MKMENIEEEMLNIHITRWEEMPHIDLYIDQVINLLDETLSNIVYKEAEGHVITKNMINNYVKKGIIPPAIKKKYTREHLSKLIIICILKSLYSITDISVIIDMLYKDNEIEKKHNLFCQEVEKAIKATFDGENYVIEAEEKCKYYALKRIVYSFANKLYVDKYFLKKI